MIGADMVGMSTVPETILAARLGFRVLAFSVITNVAAPDIASTTTHEEVLDVANQVQSKLIAILREMFTTMEID
jgi:purine-nucleoside phosphorylase